jgi:hypothetical protein
MSTAYFDANVASGFSVFSNAAHSEAELAQGVTKWLMTNFAPAITAAVQGTPFSPALLCAIACREAGAYWLPLTPHKTPADILGLAVYDASGDVAGAPRSAFPVNTAAFHAAFGDDFTNMLIGEANKARAARGLGAAGIVYKGYGLFQYDLQFVKNGDEAFFKEKKWYTFSECITRAVTELKKGYAHTHDIQETVRSYNGSGPAAEQYAQDVMRILPACEQAVAALPPAHATVSADIAAPQLGPQAAASDADPGAPADESEISETADLATAKVLANLGAVAPPEDTGLAAAASALRQQAIQPKPLLPVDLVKAKAFLNACVTCTPRVRYGLGAKVPFLGAVPGRDFTRIDCSGFVRELVRLSTTPTASFPDGSVVQHDWIRARGFEAATVADGANDDGIIRIAFLRPQDSGEHIGHVLLLSGGKTLESHGGTGPDSRTWTSLSFRTKMYLYVLAKPTT